MHSVDSRTTQYIGRYKTIMCSIAICLLGHILLIVSAVPPVIVHANGSLACLVVAMVIMGLGEPKSRFRQVARAEVHSRYWWIQE